MYYIVVALFLGGSVGATLACIDRETVRAIEMDHVSSSSGEAAALANVQAALEASESLTCLLLQHVSTC